MPQRNDKTNEHHFSRAVPLQVARWTGNRVVGTSGASSARLTLPTGASLVEIVCGEATYLNFGDNTVDAVADATSHFFPAGVQVVPVPLDSNGVPYTHVAHIQVATAGVVQVEELE